MAMKKHSRLSALMIMLWLTAAAGMAQEDAKGSADHPMLSRYPNSRISEYEKGYNTVDMLVGGAPGARPRKESLEGQLTRIRYFHNDPNSQPSALQVIRNYQNAIRSIGGKVVYERLPKPNDGGETTLVAQFGGKEVWVRVRPEIFSAPAQSYLLEILEREGMEQKVTAARLLDELNKQGFTALYLNFETNSWQIRPADAATLDEVAAALKQTPGMKVSIEGHTDNVGTPESNRALSQRRAQSVLDALVQRGVDRARLSAAGFGQERPVADNRTEEGRAKNRRVELVRK
jgi:outer membrane protein OmpA-like peptidoglycan-associated protein